MSTDAAEHARLTRVSLTYGLAQGAAVRALEDVNLTLLPGRITALVGANGSGKSSMLAVLAGRVEPQTGEVWVAGYPAPARLRGRARRDLHGLVSFVSQDPELDPEMGVGETLELLATLYGIPRSGRRPCVERSLEQLGLQVHRDKRVAELSGGLRRRLHLAGALMHAPKLLLLDEPGAGLDQEGRGAMWALLGAQAVAGSSVLVITHDLASVQAHAHEVVVMEAGRVAERGTPGALAGEHGDLVSALRSRIGNPRQPRAGARGAGRGRGSGRGSVS